MPLNDTPIDQPQGFKTCVKNIGVKDSSPDFSIVYSPAPCTSAAVYTQSTFAGVSVLISRAHLAKGQPQAIVTVSKNSNVATGEQGERDAHQLINSTAALLDIPEENVLISSTGVIGHCYPMDTMMPSLHALTPNDITDADFPSVAEAMMTTDTHPKYVSKQVGAATITGVAKGVGMIEPNMATLLTYFMTDAAIEQTELEGLFKRVMDKSFNSLSIDSDTSTSDSAVILANGLAGEVDLNDFEQALLAVAIDLVKLVARDGEGSTTLIEVNVQGARDDVQAKLVAKSIVNSPLVKTAVHGADPNWGRIAMAIGKVTGQDDIQQDRVRIAFGDVEVYPAEVTEHALNALSKLMADDEVAINVDLGIGQGDSTVWGCDLSDGYIRINADYTT
ncbi:MAG: bifunctional glutamate N-acetyltransferase/amino-acid acetyltransferase ArgJ [Pseudomonadota bacterium]